MNSKIKSWRIIIDKFAKEYSQTDCIHKEYVLSEWELFKKDLNFYEAQNMAMQLRDFNVSFLEAVKDLAYRRFLGEFHQSIPAMLKLIKEKE